MLKQDYTGMIRRCIPQYASSNSLFELYTDLKLSVI